MFKDGAVARVLAMEFLDADLEHRRADDDWKDSRKAKARSALETAARIAPG